MIYLPDNIVCGFCDCSEFKNLKISPNRTVNKFEIEYYLINGEYTFCDDKKYKIKKDYIQIAKNGQVRHSILPFSTFFLKFNADGEIADRLNNAPEYFLATHTDKIKGLFKKLILLNKNDLLYYSYIFELLNYILNDSEVPIFNGETTYQTISVAKKYIKANITNNINLSDVAEYVHLSKTYFHTVFSETVGYSPHDYLIKCRIDEAKKMLWNSENQIKDIAVNCGFGCQQYLNKVFKMQTGMTPGQYRKSVQNTYLD